MFFTAKLKDPKQKFQLKTSIVYVSSSKYLTMYQQQQIPPEFDVEINVSKGNGLPQIFSGFKSALEHG